MTSGSVVAICISPAVGAPMQEVREIEAIAGFGLFGDRYALGGGSFSKKDPAKRHLTLINNCFIAGSEYTFPQTRRNIAVTDIELMDQIGHRFKIDEVILEGVEYCSPCDRPAKLCGCGLDFRIAFHDCAGIRARIIKGGIIRVGSLVIPRR